MENKISENIALKSLKLSILYQTRSPKNTGLMSSAGRGLKELPKETDVPKTYEPGWCPSRMKSPNAWRFKEW